MLIWRWKIRHTFSVKELNFLKNEIIGLSAACTVSAGARTGRLLEMRMYTPPVSLSSSRLTGRETARRTNSDTKRQARERHLKTRARRMRVYWLYCAQSLLSVRSSELNVESHRNHGMITKCTSHHVGAVIAVSWIYRIVRLQVLIECPLQYTSRSPSTG